MCSQNKMASSKTLINLHRKSHFTLVSLLLLTICLDHVFTADINGDLVFDDVTPDPSSPFRPLNVRRRVHKEGQSTAVEKPIHESSYYSPVRFVGALSDGFQRVKRGLFDWFEPVTEKLVATDISNENSDLNVKQSAGTSLSNDSETEEQTESLPFGNTLTTKGRETRSTDSQSNELSTLELGDDDGEDDDDNIHNSGLSSGESSDDFIDKTFTPDSPYLLRITLTVLEPFSEEFENQNSRKFEEFSFDLTFSLEKLFEDLPGRRMARVVKVKKTEESFESLVVIDLEFIGSYKTGEIRSRMKRHIEHYQKLGTRSVKNDLRMREITDWGRRTYLTGTETKTCAPGEISCYSHNNEPICLSSEARCNQISECGDGYDESNCPPSQNSTTLPQITTPEISTTTTESHSLGVTQNLCRSDDQIRCTDGTVICGDQRCDGRPDCPRGDDEQNCPACPPGEFSCDVTRCIPETSVCDGKQDCADNTDESSCKGILRSHVCPEGQFMCTSGQCISVMTRCDLKVDCPEDEADEEGCPCSDSEWQCNDGTCIPDYLRCNYQRDCPSDNSDEDNCPPKANITAIQTKCDQKTHFQCKTGARECIPLDMVCNFKSECSDGSDERKCPCQENSFKCKNGHCIPREYHCDGVNHCSDRTDEINCTKCSYNEYQCSDGSCIKDIYRCDGRQDCSDGSDEYQCDMPLAPCPRSDFACLDGYCIPMSKRCDGHSDCPSGIDEVDCPDARTTGSYPTTAASVTCMPGDFRCHDGTCISQLFYCDRVKDCEDNSDENDCKVFPKTCGPGEFTCSDGQCIAQYKVCDKSPDCYDGTDELDCPCRTDEFRCGDGTCIRKAYKCDRRRDCIDNSDERDCQRDCTVDEFRCRSGDCVPYVKVCDRVSDCPDGSDEFNCPATPAPPVSCSWSQFACHSGKQCVPKHFQCDGKNDCSDGSDEFNCANPPADELLLKTYPDDQTIREGREVVFQCRDEGPLRASVRWSRGNGLPLPPGSRDQNGRLEIPNIQMSHAGSYVCEALGFHSSSHGSRVTVNLNVESYPEHVTRPPKACNISEATCSNGECIPKRSVCNGRYDCTDGSDEMRCSLSGCEPNQFTCDNKKCIQKSWHCDSDDDCGDGSDERDCGTTPPGARCRINEYECKSLDQCIPKSFHCDMQTDCQDSSDEFNCSRVYTVIEPPPMIILNQGATFTVSCKMAGVPTPEVIWRRNWGHIPPKCTTTSENGVGTIVCPDVQDSDQGAYSCEGMNSRGSTLATPDTILVVKRISNTTICPPGQFNDLASSPSDCISCFCFGKTTECHSADLFLFQLPPPLDRFQLVDVYYTPDGRIQVNHNQSSSLQSAVRSKNRGFQLLSGPSDARGYDRSYPYFSLPENYYHGNHLKSYGGHLRYTVSFNGYGQPLDNPDVILVGNGITLIHRGSPPVSNRENQRSVQFVDGEWLRRVDARRGGDTPETSEVVATRADIMVALAKIENILINVQYVTGPDIDASLSNIHMDSADTPNTGLGRANLVEECSCPAGYTGFSCEECAPGFTRQSSGPWLGSCTRVAEVCYPGYYGDPSRNIPCERCPCPLTTPSNQFGRTCKLDTDGQVTCNCPEGYAGRRCESCADGYSGNPSIPGDSCKKDYCSPSGSISSQPDPLSGQCRCKDFVTGPYCDKCKDNAFHLSTEHHKGCISCFCMGITKECRSLNWYRNQISAAFTRGTQDFKLAEASNLGQPIIQGLHVRPETRELVFDQFSRPDVYYWVLPPRFLGDKISSYGGFLKYTLRYVPTPGGQSSRNNAHDVEIISANNLRLRYFNYDTPIEPNRPTTVSVPIVESKWQREDGQTADRENFLMALADLTAILIKATYTTNTQSAVLSSVSLDIADERNTYQGRTSEVEHCSCPAGYRGFSCEDCDVGYTRTDTGLYLGICEPCNCSGHSSQCDPDSGKCFNCRDHTEGDTCELCQPGYTGNPQAGETCVPDEGTSSCQCDYRGSLSTQCRNNQCICKTNVDGPRCDRCRPGSYDLSANHPEGCLECFCSSVTDSCQSSNLYLTQIPMQIIDQNHAFTLTDSNRNEVIRDNFEINWAENKIGYDFKNQHSRRLFWSLPPDFTGNKVTSYGGNLSFTHSYSYSSLPDGKPSYDTDVVIVGNGISIYWRSEEELQPDVPAVKTIPLVASGWSRLDPLSGQRPASRADIMTALSAVEAILILATHSTHTSKTYLSDVSLDTAVPQKTGQSLATHVEVCRCPSGYRGTSCELCSPGYYRESDRRCHLCPCNGNEESCSLGPDFRVNCHCKPSFTGPYCDSIDNGTTEGPVTPPSTVQPPLISISITEPTYKIAQIGETVRLKCNGRSVDPQRPVFIVWSKDSAELPRGRAQDDRQGNLIIIDVKPSDSGVYKCTASDGSAFVTESATVIVQQLNETRVTPPSVRISPNYHEVNEGEPVEFRCEASGIPTPSLNWVGGQNNQLNPQSTFIDGVFYIPSVRKSDEASYQCIASNSGGTHSQNVVLYVRESPRTQAPPEGLLRVEPSEYNGVTGETVRLQCIPPSSDYIVSWSRGNQPLQPTATDRGGILTIFNPSASDSGVYVCTGKTISTGRRQDSHATVTIQPYRLPPSVRVEPESQTVNQGMSVELRCIATGDPLPAARWSKAQETLHDNVLITGNVLRIHKAKVADRGLYLCHAENAGGSSQATARVEVLPRETPSVELYPQAYQTVTEGNSVMFQCRITGGIPQPTLRWTRPNNLPLPSNAQELPGGALRILSVTRADEGQYVCTVENDVGRTSSIATIEVQTIPVVYITPDESSLLVSAGQRIRLDCRATGYPEPSVDWRKLYSVSGSGLGSALPDSITKSRQSAVFQISSVTADDEGIYSCTATNAAGPASKQIELLISNESDPGPIRGDVPRHIPPSDNSVLEIDNSDFKIPAGGRAQIRCNLRERDEEIFLKWVKSGTPDLPTDFFSREGILYINNVQPHDAGMYSCLGLSPSGSILFTADAKVQVVELPRITLDPVKQVVRAGDSAHITCHVYGDQPIDVSWAAVNRALPPSVTVDGGDLTFNSITANDAGKYICRAQNDYGDAEAVAEVIVSEQVHNPHPVVTAADRNPLAIEGNSVLLKCDPDSNLRITWTREQASLPQNSRVVGNALRIDNLRDEDSGRYICHAVSPSGATASDYINLSVTQRDCLERHFRCQSGECIPDSAVCDGYHHCRDNSDELNCSHRPLRGANNLTLRIDPSQDVVRVGDNIHLRCLSYGYPSARVYWSKLGDTSMANVEINDEIVRITNVQLSNGGLYRCSSNPPFGTVEEDYILNVQDPISPVDSGVVDTKIASYGHSVIMDCNVKLPSPVTYHWSKQEGELPAHASVNQGKLSIPEVTPAEAGMYICTATSGDIRMDIPTILTVTGSVPFFSQAPVSYIAVPTLRSAYLEFDIEVSFKPEHPDGLILYNGQASDGSGDFVSLGLRNGILEFRFDVGSGVAIIRAVNPVQLGQWHSVQLHRVRKEGKMYVDGEGPYIGYTLGNFQGLDLSEPMFLGSYPDFSNIHKMAGFNSGFVGCISRLVIGKDEVDLIKQAVQRLGITHCETCAVNPCENNGVCQESPTPQGYRCICPRGFSGDNCSNVGEPCYPGVCGNGKCTNTEKGLECQCPLYRGGNRCERSVSVYEPAFSGSGYVAYPTPKALHKLKMALKFNPTNISDSVLLYSAQNNYGQGDFVSISIKDHRIEFRFDTGSGPTILRSKQEIYPGQWVTVSAVRDHREGDQVHSKLSVNGYPPVIENTPGKSHGSSLNLRSPLYIGGFDRHHVKLAPGVGVRESFHGCISEVEVSGLDIDLLRSIVEASNVHECSELHGDACLLHPCQNNAVCKPSSTSPRYTCECRSGFSGPHCELEDDICKLLSPCHNKAKCTGTSSSYKCDCPLGFSGATCDSRIEFTTEVSFKGNGFIELNKDLLPHTNPDENEVVTVEFSTKNHNGILLWHGQNPDSDGEDQDYLALAVVGGYLQMSWELGNGPATITSQRKVDDGNRHTAVMKRSAREGNLKVDGEVSVSGETPGIMTQLNTGGNIYLGGLPNIEKMTGRKYSEGLHGCIHFIQIQDSGVINLWDKAISAQNALPCTSYNDLDNYEEDEDEDENAIYASRGDVVN